MNPDMVVVQAVVRQCESFFLRGLGNRVHHVGAAGLAFPASGDSTGCGEHDNFVPDAVQRSAFAANGVALSSQDVAPTLRETNRRRFYLTMRERLRNTNVEEHVVVQ